MSQLPNKLDMFPDLVDVSGSLLKKKTTTTNKNTKKESDVLSTFQKIA